MDSNPSDAELLWRSRADAAAFRTFYDRWSQKILTYFYKRTLEPQTAADLLMETFAIAFERRFHFRDVGKPAASWLFGIARRELARYWRDHHVELRAVQRLGIETPELDDESIQRIEELVDIEAFRPKLFAALEQLNPSEREAIHLRVLEDLNYEAVAEALGCSVGAARVRVHRGLSRLNAILEGAS